MGQKTAAEVRDAYVVAFNAGDLDAIEALLHPEAVYRWELQSRAETGREAVMKLYQMGHQAFQGRSRLSAVPGADGKAIWWQPEETGLEPRGLQTLRVEDGLLVEISDSHSAEKVAAAAEGAQAPE